MSKAKRFIYGTLVDADNLCNFEKEADRLIKGSLKGGRFVIFGRRNFGKTSLVRNVVAPRFSRIHSQRHQKSLVIYANFLGATERLDVDREIRMALTKALAASFPFKEAVSRLGRFFAGLRPTMSLDPLTGEPSFGIALADDGSDLPFEDSLSRIGAMASKDGIRSLLIMDEFQDLHFVPGGEAKMRDALEALPPEVAVIVLGSKKHILSRIFARTDAPLAGWGEDLEIPCIEREVYRLYANERLGMHGLFLPEESSDFLQTRMEHVPEAMNMICARLIDLYEKVPPTAKKQMITVEQIGVAILSWVDGRSDRYREYLTTFTAHEAKILAAVAGKGTVKAPQSKDFLKTIPGISSSGCAKIIKKLEDHAVIYRNSGEREGYFLADPLLAEFLKRH